MPWLQILQTVFEFVDIVLATLLPFGIRIAWKTFRGDQDQRRRSYAMHLYDEWRALLDLRALATIT